MTELENIYLGKKKNLAVKALEKDGYDVEVIQTRGNKDKEILTDELVISIQEIDKKIILITSFFKLTI